MVVAVVYVVVIVVAVVVVVLFWSSDTVMLQNFVSNAHSTCTTKLVATRLHCQRLVRTPPLPYLARAGDVGSDTMRRSFFADSGVQYACPLDERF